METSEHIAALRAEGNLLALAAERAGPDAPVPAGDAPAGSGCELTGPPAVLYLLLWNRRGTDGLELRGDTRVLDTWSRLMQVTWN
ncbi:MAG TPA: hypothetical protein VE733_26635 [Streptosporangiaceae bacterium]|nr:hypothetical protein [Streptosporangiaceae bacterium]